MQIENLISIGLTKNQAEAYALLIENGNTKPAYIAQKLKTSRTNAYKICDKLAEYSLVEKIEDGKTFSYLPKNPTAIADFTANFRAEATRRENASNVVINELLNTYYDNAAQPDTTTYIGREQVANAYRKQIALNEDIYFIQTRNDVAAMGFDTMHTIRTTPGRKGNRRYGLLEEPSNGIKNEDGHKRSNMSVTYYDKAQYSAKVEWSVTESSLLIVVYEGHEPSAIFISSKFVSQAFNQIWKILQLTFKTS